jgi:hypothetical protein
MVKLAVQITFALDLITHTPMLMLILLLFYHCRCHSTLLYLGVLGVCFFAKAKSTAKTIYLLLFGIAKQRRNVMALSRY